MADDALCTVADVKERLEEAVTSDMERVIGAMILNASDRARYYGSSSWTAANVPGVVSRIVAAVVARFMSNPSGYSQSRAADETLAWQDVDSPGELSFSEVEVEQLRAIASPDVRRRLGSFQVFAYSDAPYAGRRRPAPLDPFAARMVL